MSDTAHYLKQRLDTIKKLQTLKQRVDPASGMTISVRRGPLSQEDPPEEIQLEACDNLTETLDLLIDSQVKSLRRWQKTATNDISELQNALVDAKNAGY
jgi:hypothetical protein